MNILDRRHHLRFLLLQAAAIALLAGPSVHAADLYWDANGTTAGFGTIPAGTWGTSLFWSTSSDGTATTANTLTTTSDNIFFGTSTDGFTTNGNINFNGARSAGSITVGSANTATLTINNTTAALTLPSAATITVSSTAAGFVFQITGQITGASTSLTKAGVGTLTVTASTSNYTGATIITGGILAAEFITNGGAASAIGASSNAASNLVLNGGMFRKINSSAQTTDRLFTLGANGGILESTGSGSIDFSNTGTIAATGTEARSLRLAGNSTAANTLAPILADASEGGIVSLVKSAVGTWTVSGSNSFTGGTTVSAGTLTMGHASALGSTSGQLTVNGGVLNMAANNLTVGNLAGTGGVISGTSGSRLLTIGEGNGTGGNFRGSIQNGTGGTTALTKTGSGAITLSGANTYTGATTIAGGTLQVGASGTAGSIHSTSGVTVNSAATLAFNRTDDYGGAFTKAIDGAGMLSVLSGSVTLSGTNIYTGATTVSAGRLLAGGTAALSGSSAFTVASGAVLGLNGNNASIGSLAGSGTVENGDASTAASLTVGGDNTSTTFSGVIQNGAAAALGLTKAGSGVLTLASNSNTYTGITTISTGTLALSGAGSIASSSGVNLSAAGAGLDISGASGNSTIGSFAGAAGSTVVLGGNTLTAGDATNTIFSGAITGTGGLTKTGTGELTLASNSNTYTGATGISAGTLQITGTMAASAYTIDSGATLDLAAGSAINSGAVTFLGSGTLKLANNLLFGGTADKTVSMSAGGLIWVTGSSTIVGSSSQRGEWAANQASLQVDAGSTINFVEAGNTGVDQGIGVDALTGSGTVTAGWNGARTLFIGVAGGSGTFSGILANHPVSPTTRLMAVTKQGAGRQVLSGANTYTGATSISAGVLEIGPAGSINSTSGISVNGSTAEFKYNSATALTQPLALTQGTISGTGTIGAAVAFAAGDYLSPGNSPGEQAYTSLLTWSPLGTYEWELNALTGTAGTNWDLVNVTSGTFDLSGLSATPGNQFVLDLITLDAGNAAGPLANPFDGGSYTFPIASYDPANFVLPTGFSNTAGANLTSLFTINLGKWQGPKPQAGNVSVKINSTATGIDLVVVPEPGTIVFAGIGIAMAGWSLRNRRRAAA